MKAKIEQVRVVGYFARCWPSTPNIYWAPVVAVPIQNNTIDNAVRIASKEIGKHIAFRNSGPRNWFSFWDTHAIVVDRVIVSKYYEDMVKLPDIDWPGKDHSRKFKKDYHYRKNYLPGDLRILHAPPQPSWDHVFIRGIYRDLWPVNELMHHEQWVLLNKLYEQKELPGKVKYYDTLPLPGTCHGCGKKLVEANSADHVCQACNQEIEDGKRCGRCKSYGHTEYPSGYNRYGCTFMEKDGTYKYIGRKRSI